MARDLYPFIRYWYPLKTIIRSGRASPSVTIYTAHGHKLRFYALPLDGHVQRRKGRM
jgi:hypothetical protein